MKKEFNIISMSSLDAIVLKDSEMLELRGGVGDNITCGTNCGDNCGNNCGDHCGNNCAGTVKKGTGSTVNPSDPDE